MISTLTTSTVTLALNGSLTGILALIGVFALLALLIQKELASVAGIQYQHVAKMLNIGIVPLLIAFILIVASRVVEVIR